jgi:nucleoside-diphosphate-sugar epimerase
MSTTDHSRLIVVLGATGNQGGGVVRALLDSTTADGGLWHVRGVTRDPHSTKAQKFLADNQTIDNRLSLVAGEEYDRPSLQNAFAGAHGVFAVTSATPNVKVLGKEEETRHEIEAGRNMVLAAEACGVRHFVWSSLPDMVEATGGRFPNIHHMDNKYEIEKIARERLGGVTALIPGT